MRSGAKLSRTSPTSCRVRVAIKLGFGSVVLPPAHGLEIWVARILEIGYMMPELSLASSSSLPSPTPPAHFLAPTPSPLQRTLSLSFLSPNSTAPSRQFPVHLSPSFPSLPPPACPLSLPPACPPSLPRARLPARPVIFLSPSLPPPLAVIPSLPSPLLPLYLSLSLYLYLSISLSLSQASTIPRPPSRCPRLSSPPQSPRSPTEPTRKPDRVMSPVTPPVMPCFPTGPDQQTRARAHEQRRTRATRIIVAVYMDGGGALLRVVNKRLPRPAGRPTRPGPMSGRQRGRSAAGTDSINKLFALKEPGRGAVGPPTPCPPVTACDAESPRRADGHGHRRRRGVARCFGRRGGQRDSPRDR